MRNKKLFTLISIILILSLIFVGCGKKPHVKEKEIKNEKIVDKEEKGIEESETGDIEEDKEDIEDDETMDSEEQDNSVSNSNTSQEKKTAEEKSKKTNTSTENKSSPSIEEKDNRPTVTITIIGPEDVGTILATTEVELKDGDTVFDILKQVTKDNSIQMEYKGRKSSVYIRGIHNIYEFDHGPESGWVYRVNGQVSQSGSGTHKLNDGDKIEWLYTTQLGREFETKGGGK